MLSGVVIFFWLKLNTQFLFPVIIVNHFDMIQQKLSFCSKTCFFKFSTVSVRLN